MYYSLEDITLELRLFHIFFLSRRCQVKRLYCIASMCELCPQKQATKKKKRSRKFVGQILFIYFSCFCCFFFYAQKLKSGGGEEGRLFYVRGARIYCEVVGRSDFRRMEKCEKEIRLTGLGKNKNSSRERFAEERYLVGM